MKIDIRDHTGQIDVIRFADTRCSTYVSHSLEIMRYGEFVEFVRIFNELSNENMFVAYSDIENLIKALQKTHEIIKNEKNHGNE